MIRLGTLLLLAGLAGPALAGTAYQCTGADGRTSFQDKPCAPGQRQQTLQLDDSQPAMPAPAPAPSPLPQKDIDTAPPTPAPEPVTPLPVMYACMRATDGKTYLSENGDPQPYQVPYGILGAAQLPLSQVYGPGGGGGASAPELNRGNVTPGLIARRYVWVQDTCRELTPGETCHALRDAYDEIETKLRRAFKSDQPPLEKREAILRAQLRNC
ncbi:MAG TPA: DUF4124 domain-containing protein [Dyella sp.]|uniref:DUF4124 domain-containing protein n=1 Tax=Dyella sp. TaxID=1869338 RepID=UPI002D76B901|nr:DUF4124 domain-containing protein [Dyella sp.]HET6553883.1 DUF4124 domain-containing protein [Dyella sp.]